MRAVSPRADRTGRGRTRGAQGGNLLNERTGLSLPLLHPLLHPTRPLIRAINLEKVEGVVGGGLVGFLGGMCV